MPYGRPNNTAVGGVIGGTAGSVLFVGAGLTLAQDNANFFWDDTNNRLGIGNAAPAQPLDVTGNVRLSGDLLRAGAGQDIGTLAAPFQDAFFTTLDVAGAATIDGLVDISAAGAGQIQFPATQNASARANTLDDYEEGTWTPTDASGAGLALTINGTPSYTKIGREVTASASISYPVTADASANLTGGFPFTSANNTSVPQGTLSSSNEPTAVNYSINVNAATGNVTDSVGNGITNATLSTNFINFQSCYWV